MAKLKKKSIRLIVGGGILAVLAIALVLLLLLPIGGGEAENSSSEAVSSDTSVTLVEQKQADVKNIHIKNANGEYDIVLTGDKTWTIKALAGFEQDTNLYSLAANEIATVKASSILLDKQEELEKYGLDKPSTVVTATFADDTTFTMNIGGTDPTTGSNYMTVEGKDPIYIYSGASFFEYDLTDYVSTSIFNIEAPTTTTSTESGPVTTTEDLIFDELKIDRTDLKKPITLKKVEKEEDDEDTISLSGTYQLVSPRTVYADDSKLGTIVTGFAQLSASNVEVLKPTAAQLKERGLDKPTATVRVSYEGKTYTLKIGNKITCEATDDLDDLESGHVHSTIGYNVMRDGTDIIYNVSEFSLPWLTLKPESIMSSFVVLPNIMDVKKVTVSFDGKTHAFEPNKSVITDEDGYEEEVLTPRYNGTKTLNEDYFKFYYQVLLSTYQTGLNDGEAKGPVVLSIQYDYLDSARKSDKLEFYDNGAGAYIMSANGDMAFLTRIAYLNNIKEATAQIIENKEVIVN